MKPTCIPNKSHVLYTELDGGTIRTLEVSMYTTIRGRVRMLEEAC